MTGTCIVYCSRKVWRYQLKVQSKVINGRMMYISLNDSIIDSLCRCRFYRSRKVWRYQIKGQSKAINGRMMYKTLHRKAKIEQHEPQWKPRVNTAILKTLENTEGAIKNGQSGETSNKTKKNKTKARHNMCRTPLFTNEHK